MGGGEDRHSTNHNDKHTLRKVEITDVQEDTKDNDDILESEHSVYAQNTGARPQNDLQKILDLVVHASQCRIPHCQYPKCRKAKGLFCDGVNCERRASGGCDLCKRCFDEEQMSDDKDKRRINHKDKRARRIVNSAYLNYPKDDTKEYDDFLESEFFIADRDVQNAQTGQHRAVVKMLDLVVHVSECRSTSCQYPDCRKVKGLLRHGVLCKTRASGGCGICKKMWHLLEVHSRVCEESECRVPRCRDLRARREAKMETMRQSAKEAATMLNSMHIAT